MKPVKNNAGTKTIVKAVVSALVEKKEVKSRFQNGESLRKIAKEKGLEVVLPL